MREKPESHRERWADQSESATTMTTQVAIVGATVDCSLGTDGVRLEMIRRPDRVIE